MTGRETLWTSLRLWMAKRVMPHGYALWEYGRHSDDGLDAMVLAKEMPDG